MNMFGVGNMEVIFILVVAVLVLGPERMVGYARQAGSFYRQARRTIREIADTATVALDEKPAAKAPPSDPVPSPEDAVSRGEDADTGKAE